MKHIEVVAAIIKYQDKILCVQRGKGKYDYISLKYEFPGGKVEKGESLTEAIVREIQEELSLDIKVENPFLKVEHQYPDFSITMHSFICTSERDNLVLHEHIDSKWLELRELRGLNWAAADVPIVEKLVAQK